MFIDRNCIFTSLAVDSGSLLTSIHNAFALYSIAVYSVKRKLSGSCTVGTAQGRIAADDHSEYRHALA